MSSEIGTDLEINYSVELKQFFGFCDFSPNLYTEFCDFYS